MAPQKISPLKTIFGNLQRNFANSFQTRGAAASSSPPLYQPMVVRKPYEVIKPAKPTPNEYKLLSDNDNREAIRIHAPMIQFYRNNPALAGIDPVEVIREALKKTLIYYYPFAGRLRKVVPGNNLLVECTGEGVLFIEADADVMLEYFGDVRPPFPMKELLYNVPGSDQIINAPLLLIQVTRLKCGGFIFALRFNHTMADGDGILQFMTALGEMARGARSPNVLPVWQREIFIKKNTTQETNSYQDQEQEQVHNVVDNMVHRSIYFGREEINALHMLVPPHLSNCSTMDMLTACLWRCRTIALQPSPEDEVHIISCMNLRKRLTNPPLPIGFYGNAVTIFIAISRACELWEKPFGYALELVMKAKAKMTEEFIRSRLNGTAATGNLPHITVFNSLCVSDLTRGAFEDVDFGWGKAIYGGVAKADIGMTNNTTWFFISQENKKGERGIVVPLYLPSPAMARFVVELDKMLTYKEVSIKSAI